jgi:hypothetical protein
LHFIVIIWRLLATSFTRTWSKNKRLCWDFIKGQKQLTYDITMWVKTEFFSKQLVSSNIKLSVKIQTSFDGIQGQNLSLINGKQFQKVVWKTKLSYIISLSSYEKRTVYKSKSGWIYRNSMKWDFRNTVTYRMRNVMRNRWK